VDDAGRHGVRARMIAEPACSWTRCVGRISTSVRPTSASAARNSGSLRALAVPPGPLQHVGAGGVVHALVGDHVRDGEAPARSQYAGGFGEDGALVGGELDDAVGDDDVDGGLGARDVLEQPLTNSTFSTPAAAALVRASAGISSVMSRPMTLPLAPTRRALMGTSAPAHEPRSSTVSPS
jgi:hypothetical protein